MRSLWFLVAFGCLASATHVDDPPYGSQQYLSQQKDLLLIHKYVHQGFWNEDLFTWANKYAMKDDVDNYNNVDEVKEFTDMVDNKQLLPRFALFSIYNAEHVKQAKALLNVFLNAKNFATLSKAVSWARYNTNEKMFMYVVELTAMYRKDTDTLIMPNPFEVDPYQYINKDILKEANKQHKLGFPGVTAQNGLKRVTLDMNYASNEPNNDDQKLAYLTEDPDYNAYYSYFCAAYPHWMEGKRQGLDKDRRGEAFIAVHQQMLARYYLERLSNGLGNIPDMNWREPIASGYNPSLMFFDGKEMPTRPNNHNMYTEDNTKQVEHEEEREQRITNLIKQGELKKPEDVNTLGNWLQGNPDSPLEKNEPAVPTYLENQATAARDPLFYIYFKQLLHNFYAFMEHLGPYTEDDTSFNGVEVKSVTADKIETFFEHHNVDISNAIDVAKDPITELKNDANPDFKPDDIFVEARTKRLNHKPFSCTINVHSDSDRAAVVRIFLGPKNDEKGNLIHFNVNRKNFINLDTFMVDLKNGDNTITRNSKDSNGHVEDQTTYYELYKRVLAGISGEQTWDSDLFKGRCNFPQHLMVPKGNAEGMTYQLLVTVNPYKKAAIDRANNFNQKTSCGVGSGSRFGEDRPILFPLDRELGAFTTNIHFADVTIQHNDENGVRYP